MGGGVTPAHYFFVETATKLDLSRCPEGACTRLRLVVAHDALGDPIAIPLAVLRGKRDGPVVGITSALHGDEVNGIPVLHKLMQETDLRKLRGTIVCALVVNVPAFKRHERFTGRTDINRMFPGQPDGNAADVFAHRLVSRLVTQVDYLIDLHAASFGRINSLYVRADMHDPICAELARLQRPQIILHSPTGEQTLRGAAMSLDIPVITVEIGDPLVFQPRYIRSTLAGIRRILMHLNMLPKRAQTDAPAPLLCDYSEWLYTTTGGLLNIMVDRMDRVAAESSLAMQANVFGDVVEQYTAPFAGVIIGKSSNPVAQTGARIVHLGRVVESL